MHQIESSVTVLGVSPRWCECRGVNDDTRGQYGGVSTAVVVVIAVVLLLAGIGIVIDNLFRLRTWLNKSPPSPELPQDPDVEP